MKVAELRNIILRAKGGLSPNTLSYYRYVFKLLGSYVEEWPDKSYQIDEFMGSLKLGGQTRLLVYKCLRTVGRYAEKAYGLVDPTGDALRPVVPHKMRRYLSNDELKRVIGACVSERELVLILSLLDSSARIGEMASLRVEGFGENCFTVVGKAGQRRYRCDARLITYLKKYAVDGMVFPLMDIRREVVIPVRSCPAGSLGRRVRYIMRRAGLKGEKLGPHTLRHTAASLVARETMSALAVKALLQHDNIKTSMGYIHDVEDEVQQRVSPLKLAGEMGANVERLLCRAEGIKSGKRRSQALSAPGHHRDDVEDLFPEIPDGLGVRPKLNSEDLRLIRESFIDSMRARGESGSGSRRVRLMERMLRRVSLR